MRRRAAQRITFVHVMLLALGACGGDDASESSAVVDGGASAGRASDAGVGDGGGFDATGCTAVIALLDYRLSPAAVEIANGAAVLCAVNDGRTPHDLVVRDASRQDRGRTVVLQPGESARLSLTLTAGTYEIYCSVAGHESLGMKGPLTVR